MDAQPVEFEAELWLRGDTARRDAVISALGADLADVGGTIVDQQVVEEIDYHGVLARVPARRRIGLLTGCRGGSPTATTLDRGSGSRVAAGPLAGA